MSECTYRTLFSRDRSYFYQNADGSGSLQVEDDYYSEDFTREEMLAIYQALYLHFGPFPEGTTETGKNG